MGFEASDPVLGLLALMQRPAEAQSELLQILNLHAEWSALQKEVGAVSAARVNLESQRSAEQSKIDANVAAVEAKAIEEEGDLADIRSRLEFAEDEWRGCKLKSELYETVH